MRKPRILLVIIIIVFLIILLIWRLSLVKSKPIQFDGQRAFQDVQAQVAFGARVPDSQAHAKTILYIQKQLQNAGWQSKVQATNWKGFSVQNIIAYRTDQTPQIILGAHYDTRLLSDQDTGARRSEPVPGANDGASGVAVLLELARTLPSEVVPTWLVFFDAEDNGELDGRQWIMGSTAFVSELTFKPRAAIILDMVGDKDLNLYIEQNSNNILVTEIWGQATNLGYEEQFIQSTKYSMLDDHTPFLATGIPAVDIIDFDYPYWHTAADTPDKVSSKSLKIVGDTLRAWLISQK
jgi:glutaminyl-peptide cyclotransferase